MPISNPIDRGEGSRADGVADVTVPSFPAAANSYLVLDVHATVSSGTPSISGHGTWTQVGSDEVADNGGTLRRYGCVVGPGGSTAAVTVTNVYTCAMAAAVSEFTGVNINSGNVSAIAQVTQASSTTATPELTFANTPTNVTYGSWGVENWDIASLDTSNSTAVHDINYSYSQNDLWTFYNSSGAKQHTANMTIPTYWSGIAIELAESSNAITITSINAGANVKTGDVNIAVVGTGLNTVTSITIEGDAQTIDAGATDTDLTFDLVQDSYAFGTFNISFSDGTNTTVSTVTIAEADTVDIVTVGSYIEPDTDQRVVTSPDLAEGWVIEYEAVSGLTILDSGAIEYSGGLSTITFDVRVFDGSTWSAAVEYTINTDLAPNSMSVTTVLDSTGLFVSPDLYPASVAAGSEIEVATTTDTTLAPIALAASVAFDAATSEDINEFEPAALNTLVIFDVAVTTLASSIINIDLDRIRLRG